MVFIGCDPGKGGAIAWIEANNNSPSVDVVNMPETDSELWSLIEDKFNYHDHAHIFSRAIIERVSAGGVRTGEGKARMGATSAFTFGQQVGRLHMALTAAGIPYDVATPRRWQKELGCMSGGDKHVCKRRAEQLFPSVRVTLRNCDSLLIAEYCRRVFSNNTTPCATRDLTE